MNECEHMECPEDAVLACPDPKTPALGAIEEVQGT